MRVGKQEVRHAQVSVELQADRGQGGEFGVLPVWVLANQKKLRRQLHFGKC
jgi:hypothetical protein